MVLVTFLFLVLTIKITCPECILSPDQIVHLAKIEKLYTEREHLIAESVSDNAILHYFRYCSCKQITNPSTFCSKVFKLYFDSDHNKLRGEINTFQGYVN